jgi:hypothetical protein
MKSIIWFKKFLIYSFCAFLLFQTVQAGTLPIPSINTGSDLKNINSQMMETSFNSFNYTISHSNESVNEQLSSFPLFFIPNMGQTNEKTRFMVKGSEASFLFTDESMIFFMRELSDTLNTEAYTIKQLFINQNKAVSVKGEDLLPGKANFYYGPKFSNL